MQADSSHIRRLVSPGRLRALAALLTAGSLFLGLAGCLPDGDTPAQARAKRITSPRELIGGPTALGEVGDYLLMNDKIRVIIEDIGFASGSGLFGGSLIDADRIRETDNPDEFGTAGRDTFGEYFPAFFLEMVDPEEIEVLNDGTDGKAAIVEVRGRGGEFVTMLRFINQAMINSYEPDLAKIIDGIPANSDGEPLVRFSVRYILEPGASHVRVESSLVNASKQPLGFPNPEILSMLEIILGSSLSGFSVPVGSVLGFGELNSLFLPGAGYDLRWGLEDSYRTPIDLPAFPGFVTNFIASSNTHGTNYGFIAGESSERNFVKNKGVYSSARADDMLVLFYAAGFSGAFTHDVPPSLAPGESFTFTNYVIVGSGDVASVLDEVHAIRGTATQTVRGQVFDAHSSAPVEKNVSVLIYQAREGVDPATAGCTVEGQGLTAKKPTAFSQAFTSADGYFRFTLPPGHYCYRTRSDGRPLSDYRPFAVADKGVYLDIIAPSAATVQVLIQDEHGAPMPGKIMLVGTHQQRDDLDTRHYLFDLEAGENWRVTDMVPDDPAKPETRQYLEAIAYASADGIARLEARPGTYDVFVSRGLEYDLARHQKVELRAGKSVALSATLKRVVDTTGYLSGDFHMHARGSIDSGLSFDERVISVAAEGLETVVASDHNHVSDYAPYIYRNGLEHWLKAVIGVELTTFEFGHFNAFPLNYHPGSINRGSVPWQDLPPQQIFDALRDLGSISPEETIIQVNHPRETIMGYFGQYNVDPFTTDVTLKFQNVKPGENPLIPTVSTSTGPAFMRDCKADGVECRGNKKFESTFSWDFDAIEVFGSKRMDMLHHYRIPYAAQIGGANGWPQELAEQMVDAICADEHERELKALCADRFPLPPKPGKDAPEDETTAYNAAKAKQDGCVNSLNEGDIASWCTFDTAALFARYPQDSVMCDGNNVAFPGGLDDWYNTLNYPRTFIRGDATPAPEAPVYKRYTATGNSDSHSAGVPDFNQPGSPRNFFYVGYDEPANFQARDLVHATLNHRNIVSNGPFAFMEIGDARIGDQIVTDQAKVDIKVVVRAAPWVDANRFRIMKNGEAVALGQDGSSAFYTFELDKNGEFSTTVSVDLDKDSWFVLEVYGDKSLFPVYTPKEMPSVNVDAAIGSIAGSFGFGGNTPGLSPSETFQLTPFAFTNPIWVVKDSDKNTRRDFVPPSPPVQSCVNHQLQPRPLVAGAAEPPADAAPVRRVGRLDAVQLPAAFQSHPRHTPMERQPGDYRDVRTLFEKWNAH